MSAMSKTAVAHVLDIYLPLLTWISTWFRSCMILVQILYDFIILFDHCFLCLVQGPISRALPHPPGTDTGLQTTACSIEPFESEIAKARGGSSP